MSARRRRALALMERLRGLDIDTVSREMADVRNKMEKLRRERTELRERMETESQVTSIEAQIHVSSYVDAVTRQIRRLDAQMAQLDPILTAHEDKLKELYREQKVYESVRLRDAYREKVEREKREAAELEEITVLRWNRG
ncbi:flagellar FliJ family protein [Pseudooceanicola sp.]|uniref:flagellar FliJ family protein n=1 Tax=Pseudooceanicola sp. TaxID=1914328 RepID=UPI0035C6E0D3